MLEEMTLYKVGGFVEENVFFPIYVIMETGEYLATHDTLGNTYISNLVFEPNDEVIEFDEDDIIGFMNMFGGDGFIATKNKMIKLDDERNIATLIDPATFNEIATCYFDRDTECEDQRVLE